MRHLALPLPDVRAHPQPPALVCPCHYSTFDVRKSAEVVFGRSPIDWAKVGWLVAVAAAVAAIVLAILAAR